MYNAQNVKTKPIIVANVVIRYGFLFFTIVRKKDENTPNTNIGVIYMCKSNINT